MWLIFCGCILSARHTLQVPAAEMKDSLEDKRDVCESQGGKKTFLLIECL